MAGRRSWGKMAKDIHAHGRSGRQGHWATATHNGRAAGRQGKSAMRGTPKRLACVTAQACRRGGLVARCRLRRLPSGRARVGTARRPSFADKPLRKAAGPCRRCARPRRARRSRPRAPSPCGCGLCGDFGKPLGSPPHCAFALPPCCPAVYQPCRPMALPAAPPMCVDVLCHLSPASAACHSLACRLEGVPSGVSLCVSRGVGRFPRCTPAVAFIVGPSGLSVRLSAIALLRCESHVVCLHNRMVAPTARAKVRYSNTALNLR